MYYNKFITEHQTNVKNKDNLRSVMNIPPPHDIRSFETIIITNINLTNNTKSPNNSTSESFFGIYNYIEYNDWIKFQHLHPQLANTTLSSKHNQKVRKTDSIYYKFPSKTEDHILLLIFSPSHTKYTLQIINILGGRDATISHSGGPFDISEMNGKIYSQLYKNGVELDDQDEELLYSSLNVEVSITLNPSNPPLSAYMYGLNKSNQTYTTNNYTVFTRHTIKSIWTHRPTNFFIGAGAEEEEGGEEEGGEGGGEGGGDGGE
jgi:hypothetical protein